jgi:hypothetical protein
MNTLRRLSAGALLAGLAFATSARAEVSARTNATGTYLRTVIYASASVENPRIWSVRRPVAGSVPLNPRGDAMGDLFPVVAESPTPARWPWLVWSHFNGTDYDLVWSRWLGARWSPVTPVETVSSSDDALEPALVFGADGRPSAVWLSAGDGNAQVSMSIFLDTQWMSPFPVSEAGEDPSHPTIEVLPDGRLQIGYDTPVAHVTRIVAFAKPMTIADDLTPFGTVTVSPPPDGARVKP